MARKTLSTGVSLEAYIVGLVVAAFFIAIFALMATDWYDATASDTVGGSVLVNDRFEVVEIDGKSTNRMVVRDTVDGAEYYYERGSNGRGLMCPLSGRSGNGTS